MFQNLSLSAEFFPGEPTDSHDDRENDDAFHSSSIMNRVTCRHMIATTRTNTVAAPSCSHVMLGEG
jgi:hypothetical protein